ncbi:MAG TPA: hypothetical protein PLA41_02320 [Candidatus Pacearchaeota archaeon]|nr:hypothetical protein [Candidatus Parcubacteria bacterium]HNZ83774.1 hypothetical protein [Candidatus Pacearchaeota archaeon]HOU45961.1 hypothetical protein [Candidatus Pacearchaeota archaeon]HPM08753.1 hypothetical protein [Candidatus Pacearchaeota archaeon]HQI74640.1 hypothetical protein [Candidatus Pacearchaeota archaeon]
MNWILTGILILIALIVSIFSSLKKRKFDYYGLFSMGIVYIPLGIAIKNYFFSLFGAILMVIGALNKKKWEGPKPWEQLSPLEKKGKRIIFFIIAGFLLLGFIIYFIQLANN